jgi:hypothetical protein
MRATLMAMGGKTSTRIPERSAWVRISGDSRGWIRRAQLEFSEDVATASAGGTKAVELFRITREEIGVFSGNWEPLRDNTVKVYLVQPAQSRPLARSAIS